MPLPVLWWFAETTLVAGLLALAAAVLGRFRKLDASTRHLLWLIVLIKLLMPPVFQSPWPLERPELTAVWTAPGAPLVAAADSPAMSVPEPPPVRPEPTDSAADTEFQAVLASFESPGEPDDTAAATVAEPPATQPAAIPSAASAPGRPDGPFIPWQRWLLLGWGTVTLGLALRQISRISWFQNRMRHAVPAPVWMVDEVEGLAQAFNVEAPEVLVVPGMGTPVVWCLSRPRLLIPGHLIKSLDAVRWKGILAHELAHLHRGDQWVGRLQLAAGLLWWWNPIYWLTRRRLDAEAELACDAWVVRLLPDDRLVYAEVLLQVCTKFSQAGSPAPALGISGAGRFFERRLHMILDDSSPSRRPFAMYLALCLMALLALPSWTRPTSAAPIVMDTQAESLISEPPADSDDAKVEAEADDDADDADDKDVKADLDEVEKEVADSVKDIEKEIESALGPDFEEKIEAWAERFAKQIEEKFGDESEFVKKMEAFGKEMEEKFGEDSEFAKKMEAFGEEMERKFGDDSEFAKKMESLGKDMEKKFGPDSEFAKKMQEKFGDDSAFAKKMESLGKDMEKKFGPDSEFAKKLKEKLGDDSDLAKKLKEVAELQAKQAKDMAELDAKKAKYAAELQAKMAKDKAKKAANANLLEDKGAASPDKAATRQDRIKVLESKIKLLLKELQELKADDE